MQIPLVLLIALAVVAFVVLLVLLQKRAERARSAALQQAGVTMGLLFEPTADVDQLKAVADLPVFNHGHTRRAYNMLSRRTDGGDVKVFDYRYTTGGGKESHTYIQTIALYPGGGRALPDFMLAPESVFHKIGQAFGYQDIDFDSNPEFSSQYLLRGADETAIRAAFTPETLSFFQTEPGWTVEVRAGTAGVYRAHKRCKPEDLSTFVEQSRAVLRALVRQ
jgi:hypothetical protein